MPRPITDKDIGLKVLYSPAELDHKNGQSVIIDIVAVHGMGAHPDVTWCKAVDGDGEDKKYVNWLNEPNMLPAAVPTARIMRYGYDSQWFGEDSVRTKASTISQRLLLALKRERKECSKRPLVFVAHSFGGLIVLRTLVDAKQEEGKWPEFYNSVVGLVFFGTPFRGTHDTLSHGEILQLAEERFGSELVRGENLKILRAGDESLQDLVDMYLRIARQSAMPKVACFFEQKLTDVGAVLGKEPEKVIRRAVLVDENSGCLDLTATSDKYSLPRTHFDMNKFGRPDEEDFMTLGDVLQEMVQQGPGLIANRTRQLRKHQVPFSLKGIPAIEKFIGRAEDLERTQDFFQPGNEAQSRHKIFVLCGMGGIGKTQLAAEFLRAHKDDYSAVFWLDGSSEEQLRQSLKNAAFRIPRQELNADTQAALTDSTSNIELVVQGVIQWLSLPTNTGWILVLDNVDYDYLSQPKDSSAYNIEKYFPEVDIGSILITSRLEIIRQHFRNGFTVGQTNEDDSRGILESNGGQPIQDANAVVQRLDGLPLALAQAGAYITLNGITAAQYLKLYDRTWAELMESHARFPLPEYQSRTILTTWKLSYVQVEAKNNKAAGLLKVWSALDPSDVWFELVEAAKEVTDVEVPSWLRSLAENQLRYIDAVGLLTQYCLVRKLEGSDGHSMHPVLHQWCSTLTEERETECLRWIAASIVAEVVPADADPDAWKIQKRIYPHGNWIYRWVQDTRDAVDDVEAGIYSSMGLLFVHHAELYKAEKMYQRALTGKEKALGLDHASTLSTVGNIGNLYADQGKLVKAEEMYQRALAGKEKALGLDHTSTLDTVNNLGILYADQGKLVKAEEMYQRALAGKEKALGPDHTSTLTTVGNLGNLYKTQNRVDEADKLFQRLPNNLTRSNAVTSSTSLDSWKHFSTTPIFS